MATTNIQLIMQYKLENNIPLETELYTYATWKVKGYQVKKVLFVIIKSHCGNIEKKQ